MNAVRLAVFVVLITPPGLAQTLEGKLVPSGAPTFANFGSSLCIDGDVAIVGAPWTPVAGLNYAGAAHIYRKTGSLWTEEVRLTLPTPEIHDNFGSGVAVSGSVAVVGAPDFPVSSFTGRGAAHVYRYSGGTWIREAVLVGSDAGVDSAFGSSVAIDGNTILVAARRLGNEKVYVFEYDGNGWNETFSMGTRQTFSSFGQSLAIRGDTILIGAPGQSVGRRFRAGTVYVFRHAGLRWPLEAALRDPRPEDRTAFGTAVDFDGTQAIVGAPGDVVNGIAAGSAFLFRRTGSVWALDTQINTPMPAVGGGFGTGVGVANDMILASAPLLSLNALRSGATFVYRRSGAAWISEAPFVPSEARPDWNFGQSLDVDGTRALISAFDSRTEGVAYVYDVSRPANTFDLSYTPLPAEAGQDLKLQVTGAAPNAPTALLFSLSGTASVALPPPLGITLGLATPGLLTLTGTNAAGAIIWDIPIAASSVGAIVWLQAIQLGSASNVAVLNFIRSN